ncbi:MAG: hypothetical protein J4F37_04965 [Acidobacteria bacterium]|nr:hypothetical protein [Acidobacteriota bacterium]
MRHSSISAPAAAPHRAAGAPARTTGVFSALSIVALTFSFALAAPAAHAQSDVSGVWEIHLDTQIGEASWTATFEQDGDALSGEIDIGDRTVLPLEGKVEGASIDFTFIVPDLDGDLPITLTGQVDGETIAGDEGNFVWYGAGRWTGARK